MKKFISFELAANASFVLYGIFFIFHLFVLAGVIPQDIVWGGRIESRDDLIMFEIVSLAFLLICVLLTLLRTKYVTYLKFKRITQIGMWSVFVLFLLNTVGNLFAITLIEKLAFTPITALLSFFALRLALGKDEKIER